jgi:RecA-family ATPase
MDYQNDGGFTDHLFLGRPLISAPDYIVPLDRPYVIKGLLLTGQVSMLAGPPNIGKSSVISCLAANVALGRNIGPWRVKRSLVLYVAAEDPEGIAERTAGHWMEAPGDISHFYILGCSADLTDAAVMAEFKRHTAQLKAKTGADQLLIVFDTLNLCIGDSDENSSRDMGSAVANPREIARDLDAHVMLVHHTSAGDQGKARGSSALPANIDTLLMLRRVEEHDDTSIVVLTQEKQRSVRKGSPLVFENSSITLGHDRDGDAKTTAISRYAEPTPAFWERIKVRRSSGSQNDERAEEVLRVLRALHAKTPNTSHEAKVIAARVGEAFEQVRSNPDSLRKAVKRALDALIADGKVEADSEGGFRVATPATHPDQSNDIIH